MKVFSPLMIGLLCSSLGLAAHSTTTTSQTRECVDTFVSQELGDRPVDVRIDNRDYLPPMPLVLRTERPLRLTATDKSTGRTIATASCHPQRGLVEVSKP